MEPSGVKACSFVIQVWIEEPLDTTSETRWHASITHVATGDRRYVRRLHEICDFVAHYLSIAGVRPQGGWHCLRRLLPWLRG